MLPAAPLEREHRRRHVEELSQLDNVGTVQRPLAVQNGGKRRGRDASFFADDQMLEHVRIGDVAADGGDVKYLGPDIPAEEIVKSVQVVNARAVILSIIRSGENPLIHSDLIKLSGFLPDSVTLFIGGSGSVDYIHILKASNIKFIGSINELRNSLTILRSST